MRRLSVRLAMTSNARAVAMDDLSKQRYLLTIETDVTLG